jgi:hypothetical protein
MKAREQNLAFIIKKDIIQIKELFLIIYVLNLEA